MWTGSPSLRKDSTLGHWCIRGKIGFGGDPGGHLQTKGTAACEYDGINYNLGTFVFKYQNLRGFRATFQINGFL